VNYAYMYNINMLSHQKKHISSWDFLRKHNKMGIYDTCKKEHIFAVYNIIHL